MNCEPQVVRSRGAVGELPIHMCFLLGGNSHQIEIFKSMVEKDANLLLEAYEGADYFGENLLHIAIILKRKDLVSMLFDIESSQLSSVDTTKASRLLTAKATGTFFQVRLQVDFAKN